MCTCFYVQSKQYNDCIAGFYLKTLPPINITRSNRDFTMFRSGVTRKTEKERKISQ